MFITYFNRLCQRHSRTAFIIIGTMIIIPFVFLWGSPRDFLRGGQDGMDANAGSMYGRKISSAKWLAAMQATDLTFFMKRGFQLSQESRAHDYWVMETLRRMRALREARNQGLDSVSDEEVAASVQAMPPFQRDGKFDLELFGVFKNQYLKDRQISADAFDDLVRENIAIERLEKRVTAAVVVSPEAVRQEFNKDNEKFTGLSHTLNSFELMQEVEALHPTEKEVASYFDAHKADYPGKDDKGKATAPELNDAAKKSIRKVLQDDVARKFFADNVEKYRALLTNGKGPEDLIREKADEISKMAGKKDEEKEALRKTFDAAVNTYLQPYFIPDQKKAKVAVFPFASFKAGIAITAEKIQAYYEANKAEYSKEEVQAQHILLKTSPDLKPEQKAAKKQELEDLRKKIQGGADFGALAKTHSDDPGSKEKAGDLGWFGKGQMVPAFEAAAFGLNKGELSQIVETQFGFHLIKLTDKRAGRPLEAVKDEIQVKLLDEEAASKAEKAAAGFSEKTFRAWELALDARPPTPAVELFTKLAADEKVELKDTEWFRVKGGVVAPLGYEPELVKEGGKLSADKALTDTVKGSTAYYVACWVATKPAYLPLLMAEPGLAERAYRHYLREEATHLAREKAVAAQAEIVKKLAAGTTLEAAAGDLKFQDVPEFSRQNPPARLGVDAKALLDSLAGKPAATLLAPLEIQAGAVLLFVKTRVLPTDDEFKSQKDAATQQLKSERESEALQNFYKKLEDASMTVMSDRWQPRGRG